MRVYAHGSGRPMDVEFLINSASVQSKDVISRYGKYRHEFYLTEDNKLAYEIYKPSLSNVCPISVVLYEIVEVVEVSSDTCIVCSKEIPPGPDFCSQECENKFFFESTPTKEG